MTESERVIDREKRFLQTYGQKGRRTDRQRNKWTRCIIDKHKKEKKVKRQFVLKT